REHVQLPGAEDRADATRRTSCGEFYTCYTRARVGTAQHGRVQHSGQLDVGCVQSLAPRTVEAVDARDFTADYGQRTDRPLVERVLVDDDPDVFVAAFDFLLGADHACQVLIACSSLG